jgi:hypothetical protein
MKSEQQQLIEYQTYKQNQKPWPLMRYEIINQLIHKFNYINYLEIGVNDGTCIRNVKAEHKDGVDPGIETINPPEVNYPITSDDFFNLIAGHDIKYDIIFIDGLHYDYQVYKDITNALKHITDNGTIVCHDMNPLFEITQRKTGVVGTWNGDCWKAWAALRSELKNYSMQVVDTDHGVGIIRKGKQELLHLDLAYTTLTYDYLESNRNMVLNLITVDQFKEQYD